ncbi:uncharacterized protein [Drosophila takahashii]|uniref:uncharacterized protein isoform X1 n=1 Tax=Drosophila takahashii TaxID=29030 RepID=UPI003898FC1F
MSAQPSGNPDNSLADMFMDCNLVDENEDPEGYGPAVCQVNTTDYQSQLVHFMSPCKVPQNQIQTESETQTQTESNDSVSLVDADISISNSGSSYSVISVSSGLTNESVVSCLHSSQYNSPDEDVTIEETTDSELGLDLDTQIAVGTDMDTPKLSLKRHSPDPGDHELEIKKSALGQRSPLDNEDSRLETKNAPHDDDVPGPSTKIVGEAAKMRKRRAPDHEDDDLESKKLHRNLDEMASTSNRSVVTRSGRAVIARMNQEFDYSSKDDGEGESDDPEFLETEDEDYEQALGFVQPKWPPARKRRSLGNSSSSACSTDGSHSSPEAVPPLVYLELGGPIAVVQYEPQSNVVLEEDGELKTKVHKFLGLMAPRRKLYNPSNYCDLEKEQEQEQYESTLSLSRLLNASPVTPTKPKPSPSSKLLSQTPSTPTASWSSLNLSHLRPPTLEERQAKMYDDLVLQANANSFEEQTPDVLKEPIDLSELPSSKQVAAICRRHKRSIACLEQHPLFYRFVESLSPSTSINMCHPLALTYRESSFDSCKVALAKMLFNIFNHAIFHCGLVAPIVWRRGMSTPCKSELDVAANGKRTARLLLWENISQPGMLIKPLLHEMCHVAAFVFNRETGHGENCSRWVYQAKSRMPELPAIESCDATFKYTCTMCARCSYGRIDFEKDRLRCHYCQFEVGVKPFRKSDINNGTRPDPTITPFKSFVREKYLELGEEGGDSHSSRMTLLNEEFSKMNAPSG